MKRPPETKTPSSHARRRAVGGLVLLGVAMALGLGWLVKLREPASVGSRAPEASSSSSGTSAADRRDPASIAALPARSNDQSRRISAEAVAEPGNARRLAYLAGTSQDPAVIEAALAAIEDSYVAQAARREPFDEALDRVVAERLKSKHPSVVARALAAAAVPMVAGSPSEQLVAAVSELADEGQPPERRQAALETLSSLRPSQRSLSCLELFGAALRSSEPQLIATALDSLLASPRAWQDRVELSARWVPVVTDLVGHADPGVRGRALALLALLDGSAARTRALARTALRDPSPYVRAVACDVLGRTGEAAYIHDLMLHTSNLAEARYDLTGWTRLDGQPGHLLHTLPGRRRVAEAALYAVQTLARGAIALPFDGPGASDATLQQSIRRAQDWYARERSRLPPPLP